jgi:2-phospho-L-lactate guanylyltransferase
VTTRAASGAPSHPIVALEPLHVVVPIRSLAGGKARLGEALDAEEREELVLGMLRRTLHLLRAWPGAASVVVVSPDGPLLERLADDGVATYLQRGIGLNAGVASARDVAIRSGAAALLVIPADLPHLAVDALDALLEAADAALAASFGGPVVVVAPADARLGTNALLVAPADAIEPAFGPDSFEAHLRAADAAGAAVQVVETPALGFDLDTPDDIEHLRPGELAELMRRGR